MKLAHVKTISFGGVGDIFIVSLKLRKIATTGDHIAVESNLRSCSLISQVPGIFSFDKNFIYKAHCDSDYQQSYFKRKWPNRKPINTTWHGVYHFPGPDEIKLEGDSCFIERISSEIKYDVVIQVAAGAKSNRRWRFNVFQLRDFLRSRKIRVALVGSALDLMEDEDPDNFVGKTTLSESSQVVAEGGIFIGLSGYHTYSSLAQRIPNIHFEESSEHNKHYICDDWNPYRYGIKYGSLNEVLAGLRHWKIL